MYKSRLKIPFNITKGAKIYIPLTVCYEPHSIVVNFNGMAQEEYHNFKLTPSIIDFESNSFSFTENDDLSIEINYHYKRSSTDNFCQMFATNIITASWFGATVTSSPTIEGKRKEIFIKHYIDAQFSLDTGLYKESVLNFGTALEVILNKDLSSGTKLQNRIDACTQLSTLNAEMHKIRAYRNKVHPNKLVSFEDVTRKDAYECRTIFEIILKNMAELVSLF